MNRNSHIKSAAIMLTAGVLLSTAPAINVEASTLATAGATKEFFCVAKMEKSTVNSGAASILSSILSDAKLGTVMETRDIPVSITNAPIVNAAESSVAVIVSPTGENTDIQVTDIPSIATGNEESDSASNQTENEFANIAIAQVNDYVNIRSLPSEDGDVVGKLYANGAATVQGVEGEWVHITSGNCEGYIKGEFITIGDEALCLEHSKILAKVNTDGLNVREETNTESTILSRKETGDRLAVVDTMDEDPEWIKVTTGDKEGFVATEFVEIDRFYDSVAETKEEEQARLEKERKEAEQKQQRSGRSGGSGSYSAPSGGGGAAVASFACQFVGNPYVYGGSSLTNGADCSGFVMAVYSNFGVGLPHSSGALRGVGYEVGVDGMAPGDIVCYSGHVGIAIGGGQIVHASNPSSGIKISSAFYKNILAVRRVL